MMFTKEQIEAAHDKVKSGADFPEYVQEIKNLGVITHEVILMDGSWIFRGANDYLVKFQSGPESIHVSAFPSPERFKDILSIHQQGKTDYPTFCIQAGEAGVERWISDFESMTVTYLGKGGQVISVEPIPGI